MPSIEASLAQRRGDRMGRYNDGELVLHVKPRKVGCLILSCMHPEDHLHQQFRPEEGVCSP